MSKERPVVCIKQGTLKGRYMTSLNGRTFAAFQGIPYAKPPIGKLRFKEPMESEPWPGILDASKPGDMCLQYSHVSPPSADTEEPLRGSEDCLYANVYTPQLTQEDGPQLDVLVHIHGGAFMYGSGNNYSPRYLLDHDIVMVTFNYRVGPLGFLSTEDEVIPGNMGLKDQTAVLIWVKNNIAAFGGNPDAVTISGFSAGGVSVHYHYMSPLSRGLFKRGFSQSGNALNPWALMKAGRKKAFKLGELLGFNTKTSQTLLEMLQELPAVDIVKQVPKFQGWLYNPFSPFGPTIEKMSSNPFMTTMPIDAILQGKMLDLPWITSVTTEEGLYPAADWIANEDLRKELNKNFRKLAPFIFDYNDTVPEEEKHEIADKIRQHYKQQGTSGWNNQEIVKAISDRLYVMGAEQSIKLQASINSAPVYFYVFGYRGKYSNSDSLSGTNNNYGVSHADDQPYLMDCYFNTQETEEDRQMTSLLTDILYSFIHSGNPVPQNRDFTWKPISSGEEEIQYLYITSSNSPEMRSNADLGQKQFWIALPIEEQAFNTEDKKLLG